MAKPRTIKLAKQKKPAREVLKRSENLKKKRRVGLIVIITICFLIFLGASAFVLYSSVFKIKKVSVNGNSIVRSEEIISSTENLLNKKRWYFWPERSSFLYSRDELLQNLLTEYPRLKTASADLIELENLSVSVTERDSDTIWCQNLDDGEQCYFTDPSGFIFAKAPFFWGRTFVELSGLLPADPIGKSPLPVAVYKQTTDFAKLLPKAFNDGGLEHFQLKKTYIKDAENFEAIIGDASKENSTWRIIFDKNATAEKLAENLLSIIKSSGFQNDLKAHPNGLELIDLRFGQKVFYKFK